MTAPEVVGVWGNQLLWSDDCERRPFVPDLTNAPRVSAREWVETWNDLPSRGRSHEYMWSAKRGCYILPPENHLG